MKYATVLLAVLFETSSASASNAAYRCRGPDGRATYSSGSCASNGRVEAAWRAVSDPPRAVATSAAKHSTPRREARRRAPSGRVRVAAAPSSCDAAKAYRDEVERRVGLSRTYDLLRELNDGVYDACR